MSEPAVGLMVPSTRQNGTDNETNCGGTCAMMLNGGLILPAAVTEASPIFMPARLLQLAASACPVPNEWKASQTKAADVVRCADRMVSLLPNIFYEILRLATVRLAALQIKGIAARRLGANWKTRIAFQRDLSQNRLNRIMRQARWTAVMGVARHPRKAG
jgi:hypothetical protein